MNLKALCLPLTILVLQARLSAQQVDSTQWLSDSSRAIQFGIGSYFDVQAFDSKSISFKCHLTPMRAVRIAVSFSGSSDKDESSRRTFVDDSLITSKDQTVGPLHSFSVELLTLHLWYLSTNSDVFLYLGVGPQVQYRRSEYSTDLTTSWSAGGAGAIGAEWFVHRRISLHAEYQASALYTHGWSSSSGPDYYGEGSRIDTDHRYNRWSITSQRVVFGFSIYF